MSLSSVRRDLELPLRQVDQSEASITGCTAIFMNFYSTGADHASRVWFDVMMADSAPAGHLPLVYVCNDVLQKTKRQLGPNYLEQFSPYLAKALGHATRKAERDPTDKKTVIKIRNMVKLWGDRGVYSKRYIKELLSGMDSYKEPSSSSNRNSSPQSSDEEEEGFDLNPEEGAGQSLTFNMSVQVKTSKRKAEDVLSTAQSGSKDEEEFSMDALMRSSPSSGAEGSKRSATLSIEDLQVEASVLAKSFKKAFDKVVQGDQKLYAGDKKAVQNMFGDDLVKLYSTVHQTQTDIINLKKETILLARNQYQSSKLISDTLSDAKNSIKAEEDELVLCEKLMADLVAIRNLHSTSWKDREKRREIEAKKEKAKREEEARRREEEEGLAALQRIKEKETETEGKVWDPTRKMYVEATEFDSVNDSWRDR
ncbi:hypothetical protein TrST_g7725 [Triparma strigata]|uniref:CID domain-containing protein n=1 Tax=Triparma strigata TaxID=1606541 RepID=A0A9W6ZRF6_9STRA|nr:hypothetical protein TrST_g7725 [Triparma strigata]